MEKKFNCPVCGKEIKLEKVESEYYDHVYKATCDACGIEWELKGQVIYVVNLSNLEKIFSKGTQNVEDGKFNKYTVDEFKAKFTPCDDINDNEKF